MNGNGHGVEELEALCGMDHRLDVHMLVGRVQDRHQHQNLLLRPAVAGFVDLLGVV